ncbi:MAG: hypothetical protein K0U68_00215 [Gammaproteobacteria bacterium]|nr:hypothetical protein [Gammaproteobacteria bacterium]
MDIAYTVMPLSDIDDATVTPVLNDLQYIDWLHCSHRISWLNESPGA